jgi:hypothetical protein
MILRDNNETDSRQGKGKRPVAKRVFTQPCVICTIARTGPAGAQR